ncbi:hypothetical protein KKB18_10505 [bacterium]|nr:hypothetical protein [bacterium]
MFKRKTITTSFFIGFFGALIFLYCFPKGAISTFMHQVLHLPGPGAGIALILGPFYILLGFLSVKVAGVLGTSSLTATFFSLTYYFIVIIFHISVEGKGKFGSLWFMLALILCGISIDVLLYLFRKLKEPWRLCITAFISNTLLLWFYWIVIFPKTMGYVKMSDVPALMGVCFMGALLVGFVTIPIAKILSKILI